MEVTYFCMKILWLTTIPAPYRVDFFNLLGKLVDLTVLYERASASDRDKAWVADESVSFKSVFLRGIPFSSDKAIAPGVLRFLQRGRYNLIVNHNLSTPTGIMAIEYMRLMRLPFIIEGDGAFPGFKNNLKHQFKKHLIHAATHWLSSCKLEDRYFLDYGADPKRILWYPFTSVREADMPPASLTSEQKDVIKARFGYGKERCILSVGQFIHRKALELLIEAFASVKTSARLLIVGSGPLEGEYRAQIARLGLKNVELVPFKKREELIQYYRMCEFSVFPTREDIWGLVTNESMAQGVPVISSDRANSSLEMIKDGESGFIFPVDNTAALAERIERLLSDEPLLQKMSQAALDAARPFSLEKMADRHVEVFHEILGR